ncbi:CU044_2847 family protein [Microbacterium yannicii]|uniref:CU044_2847 family protein n=1 Tax=Microbacterium yannicii TaxID=671622 RepID=A0ABP9MLC8_9MICO|nr:CU044_2847 family protein [Microbacterium yannicii]MCO5953254.1 hypothetical protein [Microbacterium yannicii]
MGDAIRFDGADGVGILIEVTSSGGDVVRRGGIADGAVADAGKSLKQVVAQLGPLTEAFAAEVKRTGSGPDEVEVEFAVKVSADANLIIAKTTGEANFRLKLRWSGPDR